MADVWGNALTFGGKIPLQVTNNSEAEIMAITYAASALHAKGLFDDMVEVILQCDSMRALQLIRSQLPNVLVKEDSRAVELTKSEPSVVEKVALDALRGCFDEAIQVYVHHVRAYGRGNQNEKTSRKCDWIARKFMYDQRANILLGTGVQP